MNKEKKLIVARRIAIVITQKCTLNCKLCCNSMPLFKKPITVNTDEVISDIKNIFEKFDYVEWIQLVGGEILLHKDLDLIVDEIYKYKEKFSKLILMTNGTLIPNVKLLNALSKYSNRCDVQISDYGKWSYKLKENIELFNRYNIPHTVKMYHGDVQHYGGWFDNSSMEYRNYDTLTINHLFSCCTQIDLENWHFYRGKLYSCIRSLFGKELGVVVPNDDDFVNLRDECLSRDELYKKICLFKNRPPKACQYCSGFDSKNGKRYPAAEQIVRA